MHINRYGTLWYGDPFLIQYMGDLGRAIDHMRCFVDGFDLIHDPFLTGLRVALATFSPVIISRRRDTWFSQHTGNRKWSVILCGISYQLIKDQSYSPSMLMAFFRISSASFVSRSSRFKRAFSLATSDWSFPLPGALILPSSDSLASLSHLDSVLWPMPRLAAAWARYSSECSLTYWAALFLNSLSNVFLFLDLDILNSPSFTCSSIHDDVVLIMLPLSILPVHFLC